MIVFKNFDLPEFTTFIFSRDEIEVQKRNRRPVLLLDQFIGQPGSFVLFFYFSENHKVLLSAFES